MDTLYLVEEVFLVLHHIQLEHLRVVLVVVLIQMEPLEMPLRILVMASWVLQEHHITEEMATAEENNTALEMATPTMVEEEVLDIQMEAMVENLTLVVVEEEQDGRILNGIWKDLINR